jgi:hypothetical protein
MPELAMGTAARCRVRKTGPNALDPELLSPGERLAEVGALLALGLLRGRLRAAGRREKVLDILRQASDSCPKPSSGGRET